MLFMLNGTAIHKAIEMGGADLPEGHELESYHKTELTIGGECVTLAGMYDYYDGPRKILWDFKTTKSFQAGKLVAAQNAAWDSEDYFKQLNIYRAFFAPEAEQLKLWCLVQGWTKRDRVNLVEQIEVPVAPIPVVKDWVTERLEEIVKNEKDPGTIKDCTDEERWMRGTNPMRCIEYCGVNDFCPTHERYRRGK
jgi:hypothetical protein